MIKKNNNENKWNVDNLNFFDFIYNCQNRHKDKLYECIE